MAVGQERPQEVQVHAVSPARRCSSLDRAASIRRTHSSWPRISSDSNMPKPAALPVTATLVATTAALSAVWSVCDGWLFSPDWQQFTLPGILTNYPLQGVAGAVLWTGLISTSLNFFIELTALGRVPPSEASVILASEPLWAALFAAAFYGTSLTTGDAVSS